MIGQFGPRLVIMAKEPRAGLVKSRLGRDAGPVLATRFYRLNLSMTLKRLARDPRWRTLLAVSPDTAVASRMLPSPVVRVPQGGGDLGVRIARAARSLPSGPLIVIGSDIPAIQASDIAIAFRELASCDFLFGPSGDGGYWLVGLNARRRRASSFRNVRWSSRHALSDTLANFGGRQVKFTSPKDDVDTGSDLKRLGACNGRLVLRR